MNRKEKEVMLKEEYKAEKLISIIRLYFIGFLALVNIAKHYHLKGLFHIPLIPSYLIFLLALGIYIEIQFFWKEKYYRFYNRAIKFFYISLDVAALSYFIYSNIIPNEIAGYINVPPETLFSLVFSLISTFLLIIGILRFNPSSLIYTGILLCISYIYSIQKLFVYPDFQKLFLDYGLYKPANNIFFISLFLMVPLSAYISIRLRNILVKSKRQELLERFLPAQVAEDALNGKIDISTGGNKYYATILFSDIRNFTTMSEESNPEEIVDFLNSYFNDMIEIIFHYRGSLDKIIGDGIMAIYGAPLVTELTPKNAVKTAVDMIRKLSDFNLIRQIQNKPPIQIGIGIHTGEVIVGNIGSSQRMEYTAIGDTVNTASRLESYTKTVGAEIIISEETKKHLNGEFVLEDIGDISLKGKSKQIRGYRVIL